MTPRCAVCGRRLHDPASRARGTGPVCHRRATPTQPPPTPTRPAERPTAVAGQLALEDTVADRPTASSITDEHLDALYAELDELLAELDGRDEEARERWIAKQLAETGMKSMDFRNGMTMEIEPARDMVAQWVGAARAMLGDAPNYTETPVEMQVKVGESPEQFAFVLQRVAPDALTPHQARQRAEDERDRAREVAVVLEQECARLAEEVAAARARLVAEHERARAAAAAARGDEARLAHDGIVVGLDTAIRLLDGAGGHGRPQESHENGQTAPEAPGSPPEASRGAEAGVRPADGRSAAREAAAVRAEPTLPAGDAASRPHGGPQSAEQPAPALDVHPTRERPPQGRCEPHGENPQEDQP